MRLFCAACFMSLALVLAFALGDLKGASEATPMLEAMRILVGAVLALGWATLAVAFRETK